MSAPGPGFLMTLLSFVAVIAPLIFVHELGHYLAGRWFGVKTEVFSIGFGREIAGWSDRRGTRWKIGWMPMGGYVKFAGDMSPASTPTDDWLALPAEERARTFQSKPNWQKAVIVAAGPVTNFLVAILIFVAFFATFGEPRTPARVGAFELNSPAAAAGLRTGDLIKSMGGRQIEDFDDLQRYVVLRPQQTVDIVAERDGRTLSLPVRLGQMFEVDRFGNKTAFGKLGIYSGKPVIDRLSPLEVPGAALRHTWATLGLMTDSLGQIISGARPVKELGGPLTIARVSGEQAQAGWLSFAEFVALISINLGFINLLPVPILDGGHLMFYAIAAVRRRPISTRALEWSFKGGLAVLLALMMLVTFNDLASFGLLSKLGGLIG